MRRTILFVPLVLVLLLGIGLLSACGGTPEPTETEPPAPTATPAPQEEPTSPPPEPTEEEEPSPEPTEEEEPTAEPTEEPEEPPASDDQGLALMEERCTVCHTLDRVTRASKSREQWEQTVDRMIGRGAELNDDERSILIDYLTETYGP